MHFINKELKIPLYLQLANILISKIENNMVENDKIISEREICDAYSVSRTTVRQALNQLEKEGYIYKIRGKGTFVSSKRLKQDLISFYSFTEEMKKLGKEAKSEVVGFEIVSAKEKIGRIYGVSEDEVMYKITRIRKADDIPMMYEITYLPYELFKGLNKEYLESRAMYDILINEFNVKLTSAEEYFEPILTKKLESIYLGIPQGAPSLKIERLTYDDEKLVEYTIGIARGDKFKYRVHLNNK